MEDFIDIKFDRPVLASVAQDTRSPYTEEEWGRMLGYNFNDMANTQPVRNDFYTAMGQLTDRSMDLTSSYVPVQAQRQVPQAHVQVQTQPKEEKPVVVALATWCGYSKKAMAAHTQFGVKDKVQELYCDKQDKTHPMCKKTRGYPTYYKADGSVLKSGFPVQDPKGFYTSL